MANYQIRVVGKRRDVIDVKRLADALLDLIDNLSDHDREKLAADGERALGQKRQKQSKGTAA